MSKIEALPLTRKILGLLPLLLLASCSPGQEHFGGGPATFASNGERIYFSGTSASGQAIIASGGSSMMSRHRQMHGGGCAVCHGAEREGKRLWPQFWIKAPALTAEALFSDKLEHEGHTDHGNYDTESLRMAIAAGVNPKGEPFDAAMPRWTMSPADLEDLVTYLRQTAVPD
ncbi:MAG: cytochrome c [Gammaproteobacteria bacterium]|nr:MAG: cytochrome c [Gammaproteobacteria bacterium]UCH39033.1 MAG: cytochrome c [Gammaproteobacteria bacterium]